MKIKTNAENRKDVVKAVAGILNTPSKYLGVPSCNFQVGNCIIDRAGTVEVKDEKTTEMLLAGLVERGFVDAPDTDEGKLLVSLPMDGMTALNFKNFIFLIHSRQYLINQSIGEKTFCIPDGLVEELEGNEHQMPEEVLAAFHANDSECRGISMSAEQITFRFPYTEDAVKAKAYTDLSAAMVKQAKEQKRIDAEERIEENEKYYMRIWLLRIGFGGRDMKDSRNALMENLKGHSAFRTQADIDRAKVRTKQKSDAKKLVDQEAQEGAGGGETAAVGETVAGLEFSETGAEDEKGNPTEAA